MSYFVDKQDENAVVMQGIENGISDNPYQGISDIRNCNIISVPGEASVNFATAKTSAPVLTVNVTSVDTVTDILTIDSTPTLETGQAIYFSAVTFTGAGFSTNIGVGTSTSGAYFWVKKLSDTTIKLYDGTDTADATYLVNITGAGTGTFSTVNIGLPKHYTNDPTLGGTYLVDNLGHVWTNARTTTSGYFIFVGNKAPTNTYTDGNGLVYYEASDSSAFIFIIHNSSIDYFSPDTGATWGSASFTYQWDPAAGTAAGYNATPTAKLKTLVGTKNSHEAIVAPDNKVYFCDKNWVDRFYQKSAGTAFVPSNTATYIWDQTSVLPFTDVAQCLTPLGNNILVGGRKNVVYPWDTFSPLPQYPILLAESNIQKLVTVNTNAYAFAGNRGRIYITNGSQAQLFKKIPDHISGTVEPYFVWGGATSQKNQLYFGFYVTTNAGVTNNNYGGLWAIDVDTQALRLVNKLSFGTYAGYVSAVAPNFATNPAGTGLYIGWYDGVSAYGIDTTVSTPYVNSEATIDFDIIPIGTYFRPKEFKTVEYKLSTPMVTGESVSIYQRLNLTGSYTLIFTSNGTTGSGSISDNNPVNFDNAQWVQLRAVINSIASGQSYTRLREVRIK